MKIRAIRVFFWGYRVEKELMDWEILRRVANRSAAHEQGLLSRGPEGKEFRAAEAGCKNGVRASVRKELQDIAVRNRICLRHKEITRGVEGQAARKS